LTLDGWSFDNAAVRLRTELAKMFSRLGFSQHPDQHGPKRPVLLAVDQEFDHLITHRC
jgi:hypothetical protein